MNATSPAAPGAAVPIAFWLVPAAVEHEAFGERIARLAARHRGPVFEPHMTLHVGTAAADQDIGVLLAGFARDTPPVVLMTGQTAHSPAYYKALYVELVEPGPPAEPLAAVRRRLERALLPAPPSRADAPPSAGYRLEPHLSLLYGDFDAALRTRLAADEAIDCQAVRFDTIAAVRPAAGFNDLARVERWDVFGHTRLTGASAR